MRTARVRTLMMYGLVAVGLIAAGWPVSAQTCTRNGANVTCDDGRTGMFVGDVIVWPDGTKSHAARQNPSVIIGNGASVRVGQGVFVGKGKGGVEQLDDPSKKRCATLDGVSYCN